MQTMPQLLPAQNDSVAVKPVLAMMGEFSAGKSTLLNMLLAQPLIPSHIVATQLPVLWLRYGKVTDWQGVLPDGQADDPVPGLPDWTALADFGLVRITLDNPLLKHCDVIDTPGISDPRVSTGLLQQVAEHADFCLWCSAANQAWRQSEKAAWTALPDRLRVASILAVTRADQLAKISDLARVVKRLKNEAGDVFSAVMPVSAHLGMTALTNGQLTDPQQWADSGAKALQQQIRKSLQIVPNTPRPAPAPPYPAKAEPEPEPATPHAAFLSRMDQGRALLRRARQTDKAHRDVLLCCLSCDPELTIDYPKAMIQVEQELEDFSKGAWCRLDKT